MDRGPDRPRRRRRRHPARRTRRAVGIGATAASFALVGALAFNTGTATADNAATDQGATDQGATTPLAAPAQPDQQIARDDGGEHAWDEHESDEHEWESDDGATLRVFPPATASQGAAVSPPVTSSHGS